jgi:hypothetical protein
MSDITEIYKQALGRAIRQYLQLEQPVMNKYKFSRNWYQAQFDTKYYYEVDAWCSQQFGPHPKRPDAWSRWWHKFEDSILFRDEKDYLLFTLRWGV